jgi:hypothetical protein
MPDDRNVTPSSQAVTQPMVWNSESNPDSLAGLRWRRGGH